METISKFSICRKPELRAPPKKVKKEDPTELKITEA